LTSLNLASNDIGGYKEEYYFIATPEGHTQSYCTYPAHISLISLLSGPAAIADAIKDMGALTKLTFGDEQVVTMTTEMTEANFSAGKLKSYEAQIVAAFLPKCT
jgi:hypothetical protein